MLRWRLILGVLLIAVLVGLCWIDHSIARRGMVLWVVVCGLGVLATEEMLHLFRQREQRSGGVGVQLSVFLVILLAGAPVLSQSFAAVATVGYGGWLALGLVAGLLTSIVGAMRRFRPADNSVSQGGATIRFAQNVLAVAYIGGLLSFLIVLRISQPGLDHDWGLLALVSMIVVVKLGDTGAYTFGRLLGRHKMAPTLSPGKTWEGTAGGLTCSCLGAWLSLDAIPNWLGWADGGVMEVGVPNWIAYGLVVGIAGIIGDLAESFLKRDAGVKDSSTWMPGFGGILDLLDSLLVAAPVAYLCWVLA